MEKLQATLADVEANNVMSNNEVERLAKLEEAINKSRQEIISLKNFLVVGFFLFA